MPRAPKPTVDRASYRAGYQAGIAAKRRHPDGGPGVADLYFAACMTGLLAAGRDITEQTERHPFAPTAIAILGKTQQMLELLREINTLGDDNKGPENITPAFVVDQSLEILKFTIALHEYMYLGEALVKLAGVDDGRR